MREVNNNPEYGKIQKTDLRLNKIDEKSESMPCASTEEKKVQDFSNPAEILGRSQVNKTDNLKEDVSFGMAHPEAIASADKFFDITYANLVKANDPNAYEKAASMASIYARELV